MRKLLLLALVVLGLAGQPAASDRVSYCPDVYAAISAVQVAMAQCYVVYQGDELVACVQGGSAVLSALANELSICSWQQDGGD